MITPTREKEVSHTVDLILLISDNNISFTLEPNTTSVSSAIGSIVPNLCLRSDDNGIVIVVVMNGFLSPAYVVPTLDGWRGYLPWRREGVPTLDGGTSTYLGWEGGTYLRGTYHQWRWEGYLTWMGRGGTYPGQVMLWVVCLLRLPAGGLSCVCTHLWRKQHCCCIVWTGLEEILNFPCNASFTPSDSIWDTIVVPQMLSSVQISDSVTMFKMCCADTIHIQHQCHLVSTSWVSQLSQFLPPAYVRTTGGYVFTGVCLFRGGPRSQIFGGGGWVPGLRFLGGGPGLKFLGWGWGSQVSDFWGGGAVPGLSKGKNFWHQIWLDTCSDQKNFFVEGPPPPPK